jgi:glycosyltransferase involved in cell wall biosynthesis
MIVGTNLLSLRIDGGGTRHFAESLLLELTTPPFSSRYLLFLMCLPDLKGHLEGMFGSAPNVVIFTAESEQDVERCRDLFDLYFCPLNALSPVLRNKPSVACLMDIQEQFLPGFFSKEEIALRSKLYPSLVRDATIACTISDFCAKSFVEKMGASPEKVKTVRLFPQKRILDAGSCLPTDCPEEFILYPANWYEHKNHRNLVHGYLEARAHSPLPELVLVGHLMGQSGWFEDLRQHNDLMQHVKTYTEISPGGLRALYEHCSYVVLPTLFEGYCMPLAEAILLHKPVLANDLPVMREVGGEQPVYRTLENAEHIRDAILEMSRHAPQTEFGGLPPALKDWSWERIAQEYDVIFHEAMIRHRLGDFSV